MCAASYLHKISGGYVEGFLSPNGKTASWLGIPYAAPPVGDLRWRAPQPCVPWSGVRPAKSFSAPSIQYDGCGVIGSEDCLYLNVFRPDNEEAGLPVLFFIHGGNNQTDSGEMLDGNAMADYLSALVITINIRLNALGWLRLPALKTGNPNEDSGNFGLLDILAALNWTHENIEAFGGDAQNITACGYSSGARNLLCMLSSPAFEGKFARAITFSGGYTVSEPEAAACVAARSLAPLAVEDKMADSEAEAIKWILSENNEVRQWLYSVRGQRFGALMQNAAMRMAVFPHLFGDGVLIPREGLAALREGWAMKLPKMCLSGGNEFALHLNIDPMFIDADFSDPSVVREYGFAAKYGGHLFGYLNAEQNAKAFSAISGHAPVYAGRCAWGMDALVTDKIAALRVGGTHGLDLCLIMEMERDDFAVSENVWSESNRAGRQALSEVYRSYMSSFIRTGNPNAHGLPVWYAWSGAGSLMRFDAGNNEARIGMTEEIVSENFVLEALRDDLSLPPDRKEYILKNVLNGRFFSTNLDKLCEVLF